MILEEQNMTIWVILWMLLSSVFAIVVLCLVAVVTIARNNRKRAVGFFHPYTNDGGGGERVLWCAVKAIQELNPNLGCIIYTGDDASPQSLLERAVNRFGVKFLYPPKVVRLYKRKWIEESTYPRFRTLVQYFLLGRLYANAPLHFILILVAMHLLIHLPEFLGAKSFPILTTQQSAQICIWLSRCKLLYYLFLIWIYGLVGSYAHLAMVNSSWTKAHIEKLWKIPSCTRKVYPPSDTNALQALWSTISSRSALPLALYPWPLTLTFCSMVSTVRKERKHYSIGGVLVHGIIFLDQPIPSLADRHFRWKDQSRPVKTLTIISVAQFRPEKAQALQLEAFALAIQRLDSSSHGPNLQFVGSCRNKDDEARLLKLKIRSMELNVDKHVEFDKDLLYRDLVQLLRGAVAGIHSMIDEHFGICVVEYMAAGAIPIAHNCAGPKMDIVQQTGFLASTVEEYADAIVKVLSMSKEQRLKMATAARKSAERFSEAFKAAIEPLLSTDSHLH